METLQQKYRNADIILSEPIPLKDSHEEKDMLRNLSGELEKLCSENRKWIFAKHIVENSMYEDDRHIDRAGTAKWVKDIYTAIRESNTDVQPNAQQNRFQGNNGYPRIR